MEYIQEIVDEIDSRMENVKIFYPFFEIYRSGKRKEDQDYDISTLCMAVLSLLVYEGRLKNKPIDFAEITAFVIDFIKTAWGHVIDEEEGKRWAGLILDKLQNNGGNFIFDYYSFTSGAYKSKIIKLVEMKLDDDGKGFKYYITKEGLDFFLKTKEFPEEAQITINLLLFKKQIEKGTFDYALETVKRLNVEVQRKIEKKNWILELMMYGGKEGSAAYRDYHKSAMLQFEEENALFNDVSVIINDVYDGYRDKLERQVITEEELKAFEVIRQIEREMRMAMSSHNQLLKEAASLTREYDNILMMRRKAVFSEKFNFAGELEKVVAEGLNPEVLKYFIEPLLRPNRRKIFNPLKAFEPQKIKDQNSKIDYEEIEEQEKVNRETIDDVVKKRVDYNFRVYAFHLLKTIMTYGKITLEQWVVELKRDYGERIVQNGDFISYVIEINRGKALNSRIRRFDLKGKLHKQENELPYIDSLFREILCSENLNFDYNGLEVESLPEEDVDLGYGVKITNLVIRGV